MSVVMVVRSVRRAVAVRFSWSMGMVGTGVARVRVVVRRREIREKGVRSCIFEGWVGWSGKWCLGFGGGY